MDHHPRGKEETMETLLRWFSDTTKVEPPADLRTAAGVSTSMHGRRLFLRNALERLRSVPVRRVCRVAATEYPLPLLTAPD